MVSVLVPCNSPAMWFVGEDQDWCVLGRPNGGDRGCVIAYGCETGAFIGLGCEWTGTVF